MNSGRLLLQQHVLEQITRGTVTKQAGTNPVLNTSATSRPSMTSSVTVAAGTDRAIIFVGGGEVGATSFSSVTFNGAALQRVARVKATTWGFVEVWLMIGPAVTTADLVATASGSDHIQGAVYVLDGVDPIYPAYGVELGFADTGTSVTRTVSGLDAGAFLIDVLDIDGSGHSNVAGANQTEDLDFEVSGGTTVIASNQSGADGGIMSHSWTTSAPNSHIVIGLRPAETAGGSPQTVPVSALTSSAQIGGVEADYLVAVLGLDSAGAFGSPAALPGAVTRTITGLGSVAAFDTPSVSGAGATAPVTGLGSAAQFGSVAADQALVIVGLNSAGQLGVVAIVVGGTTIPISGLSSASQFGTPDIGGGSAPTFSPAIHGGKFR